MIEHLILDERKSSKAVGGEINPFRSLESNLRTGAGQDLGVQAVSLLCSLDTMGSTEHSDTSDEPARKGGAESMANNQEGVYNAELFKRAYDVAVESIDDALGGNINELKEKIPIILGSIDALRSTPYISSAPEFVDMVEAARSIVDATNSFTTADDGEDMNPVFASFLSQARHQLAGTLIAYRT